MAFKSKHILGLRYMDKEDIELILKTAEGMKDIHTRTIRKVPTLRGKIVVNLFYEPSTRTRTSFELAAKRLSADVVNFSTSTSSVVKGETLDDTVKTLHAMGANVLVMRHSSSGAPDMIAQRLDIGVVNAGDGTNEHPTQALLDMFTIRERLGRIEGLTVAIVGDILHSRVARSNIWGLKKMGARVKVIGPPTLIPKQIEKMGAEVCYSLEEGIKDVDVINVLRIQRERMTGNFFPSIREYSRLYGITEERLRKTKPGLIVMHPGPLNREVEITSQVADSQRSTVLNQVTNGIAIRMAVLYLLAVGRGIETREQAEM